MTRYIEAFSWPDSIGSFVKHIVKEKPVLNVCAGAMEFGDVQLEKYHFPKDWFGANGTRIKGDMISLPFKDNAFGSVFSDPPWDASMKESCSKLFWEALRVAPVFYLMSPWVMGTQRAKLTNIWVRDFRGINNAILITRYERNGMSHDHSSSEKGGGSE